MKRHYAVVGAAIVAVFVLVACLGSASAAGPNQANHGHHGKVCKKGFHRNGKRCVKNKPQTKVVPGPQGPTGPAGPQGEQGAAGTDNEGQAVTDLVLFCAAHPGALPVCNDPLPATDVIRVRTLDGSQGWFATAGDEAEEHTPSPTLTPQGVVTELGGGGEYASVRFPVSTTFGGISKLAYSAGYTQDPDQHGGMPYFRVFFADDPVCGGASEQDRLVFSANTQATNLSTSGDYRAFDVTAGTVRYNDDPGAEEATSTLTWNQAKALLGSKQVCQIAVSSGAGGAYSEGATTTVGSVTIEGLGIPQTTYVFG